jgi:hypothetical protein
LLMAGVSGPWSAGWIGGNGSVVQKGGGYRRRCRAVAGGCGPNRHHCQVARRVRRVVVEGFGLGLLLLFSWIPSVNCLLLRRQDLTKIIFVVHVCHTILM